MLFIFEKPPDKKNLKWEKEQRRKYMMSAARCYACNILLRKTID